MLLGYMMLIINDYNCQIFPGGSLHGFVTYVLDSDFVVSSNPVELLRSFSE